MVIFKKLNLLNKYSINGLWLLLENILKMLIGLLISVWVARYLGPNDFGILALSQSLFAVFSILSGFGIDSLILKELVVKKYNEKEILGTSVAIRFASSLLTLFIVIIITCYFYTEQPLKNMLIFFSISSVFSSFNVFTYYFQSNELNKYIVISNIISIFISSISKIILIVCDLPVEYFAAISVLDAIIAVTSLLVFYKKDSANSIFHWYINVKLAKKMIRLSLPLLMSSLVLIIQARIDQVMLEHMLGNADVGYYSVALRLVEMFGFIPMILKTIFYPEIQRQRKDSKNINNFILSLSNYYRINFLAFLIIAIPLYFISIPIVNLLYGSDYQLSGQLLSLMTFRLFFTNMGTARGVFILMENMFTYSFVTMIVGSIANILLNYLFIYKYGVSGAIMSTYISFFITTFFIDIIYSKSRLNALIQIKSIFTFYKIKLPI